MLRARTRCVLAPGGESARRCTCEEAVPAVATSGPLRICVAAPVPRAPLPALAHSIVPRAPTSPRFSRADMPGNAPHENAASCRQSMTLPTTSMRTDPCRKWGIDSTFDTCGRTRVQPWLKLASLVHMGS